MYFRIQSSKDSTSPMSETCKIWTGQVKLKDPKPDWACKGSGDRFLVHTGSVHGGFAVLLRTSCYEFVIMILYCINMLDMKYACCRVDMCCVG